MVNSFEVLTKESFKALESRQASFMLIRLERLIEQLDQLAFFLDAYMEETSSAVHKACRK